jgi:DNA-binding XRE family transcriptional regulator
MTLDEWMQRAGMSQSDVARTLGTTRQAVQSWSCGRVRPSLYFALALSALTEDQVTVLSWLEQSERLAIQGLWAMAGKR